MRISDWSSDVCSSDLEAFDVVWPGEIMARAHHGGSACGNAETEGFAHLPADRDRKEHGGKEAVTGTNRSEEHTSELQSLMRNTYDVFRLTKKKYHIRHDHIH